MSLPQHEQSVETGPIFGGELISRIEDLYHLSLRPIGRLGGGDECEIWQARTKSGALVVVRISPHWRDLAHLAWTHELILSIHGQLPVVTAPLQAGNGASLFVYNGHPVALFPFVPGKPLDRDQEKPRQAAAILLARLHQALLGSPAALNEPGPGPLIGSPYKAVPDLPALVDPGLDEWHVHLAQSEPVYHRGPIHGDFYRRNLLAIGENITGLLDWDDAHVDFLMQEVAFATWEFCKTPDDESWNLEHAGNFLAAYREAGGPCQVSETAQLIPYIRWRLREEVRFYQSAMAAGQEMDLLEMQKRLTTFLRLKPEPKSGVLD